MPSPTIRGFFNSVLGGARQGASGLADGVRGKWPLNLYSTQPGMYRAGRALGSQVTKPRMIGLGVAGALGAGGLAASSAFQPHAAPSNTGPAVQQMGANTPKPTRSPRDEERMRMLADITGAIGRGASPGGGLAAGAASAAGQAATTPTQDLPPEGWWDNLPNWQKALLVGGGAGGIGLLGHKFLGASDDEDEEERSGSNWAGPLLGAGALGLGAYGLSGGDFGKFVDPAWWNKTGCAVPIVLIPRVGGLTKRAGPWLDRGKALLGGIGTGAGRLGQAGRAVKGPATLVGGAGMVGYGVGNSHARGSAAATDATRATTLNQQGNQQYDALARPQPQPQQAPQAGPPGMFDNIAGWRMPWAGGQQPKPPGTVTGQPTPGMEGGAPGRFDTIAGWRMPWASDQPQQRGPTNGLAGGAAGAGAGATGGAAVGMQNLAKEAPPEVQAQGPGAVMQWVHDTWNSIPEGMRWPLIAGLGLGALSLVSGLSGEDGGFGGGGMSNLLGAGALGLGGYAAYKGGYLDNFLPESWRGGPAAAAPPGGAPGGAAPPGGAPGAAGGAGAGTNPTQAGGAPPLNASGVAQNPAAVDAAVQGFRNIVGQNNPRTTFEFIRDNIKNLTPEQQQQAMSQLSPQEWDTLQAQAKKLADNYGFFSSEAANAPAEIMKARQEAMQRQQQQQMQAGGPQLPYGISADAHRIMQLPPEQHDAEIRKLVATQNNITPEAVTPEQVRQLEAKLQDEVANFDAGEVLYQQKLSEGVELDPSQITPTMISALRDKMMRDQIRTNIARHYGRKPEEVTEDQISRIIEFDKKPPTWLEGLMHVGSDQAITHGLRRAGSAALTRTIGSRLPAAAGGPGGFLLANVGMDMADRAGILPEWAGGESAMGGRTGASTLHETEGLRNAFDAAVADHRRRVERGEPIDPKNYLRAVGLPALAMLNGITNPISSTEGALVTRPAEKQELGGHYRDVLNESLQRGIAPQRLADGTFVVPKENGVPLTDATRKSLEQARTLNQQKLDSYWNRGVNLNPLAWWRGESEFPINPSNWLNW